MKTHLLICLGLLASTYSWSACLPDVEASFKRLSENVTPLSAWTQDFFTSRNMYRQKLANKIGLNTHFQGLARIPGTTKFILSGGDFYTRTGNLFVIDFASQAGKEFLEKNFNEDETQTASDQDKFIASVVAGTKNSWHVGGLGILDNILVAPVENALAGNSVINFYDVSNPLEPVKLDISIPRNFKTGSVIIYRNSHNKIVVGGNSDQLKIMELFQSRTSDIRDGFELQSRLVEMEANGQGGVILNQCDGKKYLIDFNNTSKMPPIIWGKDYVRLYSVDETTFTLELKDKRIFDTRKFCNFKASGTASITENGKLAIYGSHFYRHGKGKRVKLCQFSEE